MARHGGSADIHTGRRCIFTLNQILVGWIRDIILKEPYDVAILHQTYKGFYEEYQHLLGHYFRNLYTIIKMVDQSSIERKRDYTNIIRAQLSSSELVLLCYNCISPWGEKFKPLVEKYSLLKTLPEGSLADERDRLLYLSSAFGTSTEKL